jgi:hypothetical protein
MREREAHYYSLRSNWEKEVNTQLHIGETGRGIILWKIESLETEGSWGEQ